MNDSSNHVGVLDSPPVPGRQAVARMGSWRTMLDWLGRTISSVVVFAALGGLLWWGHHTGWKLPKFSALAGTASEGKDDWCSEHSVPESICVECNAGLMPGASRTAGARRHGVHECPLEHPDVAQTPPPPSSRRAISNGRSVPWPSPIGPRTTASASCTSAASSSPPTRPSRRPGSRSSRCGPRPVVEFVAGNGEIGYDQTRTARLSARVPGSVFRAFKEVGDPVRDGEVLALVDAAEVGKAKSEFLTALVQARTEGRDVERLQSGRRRGPIPGRTVPGSSGRCSEATIRLTTAAGSPGQPGPAGRCGPPQGAGRREARGPRSGSSACRTKGRARLDGRTTTANLLAVRPRSTGSWWPVTWWPARSWTAAGRCSSWPTPGGCG